MIDEVLLQQARARGIKLSAAEGAVTLARAEYHTAIRRLHLGGGTLREIASALQLSHQRVQQIVEHAGGTWWGRVWKSRNARRDAVCTFCGRPPSEVARLVAGPDVYVCDGCVARAEQVLLGRARAAETMREVERRSRVRCSFCGKKAAEARVVAQGKDAAVCEACLPLCRQFVDGGREHAR